MDVNCHMKESNSSEDPLMYVLECIPGYTGTHIPQSDGFYVRTFPCIPCPQGTYKEDIGWLECNICEEGTTTTGTGHTSASDCSM